MFLTRSIIIQAEEAFPDVLRGPVTNSDDYIRLSGMYLQDQKSKADGKHAVVSLCMPSHLEYAYTTLHLLSQCADGSFSLEVIYSTL